MTPKLPDPTHPRANPAAPAAGVPRVSFRVWFPIMILILAVAMVFLYFLVQSTPVDPDAIKSRP